MTIIFLACIVLGAFCLWHEKLAASFMAFSVAWFGPVVVMAFTDGFDQAMPELLFRVGITVVAAAVCAAVVHVGSKK